MASYPGCSTQFGLIPSKESIQAIPKAYQLQSFKSWHTYLFIDSSALESILCYGLGSTP
jgi:hypothetical protein